jgi:chromatin remodeling complex protein RSC6
MVRAAKTTESTPAPVAEKPKAEKKVKAPKESKSDVAAPAPAPVAEPVATDSEQSDVSSLTSKLADFGEKINKLTSVVAAMKNEYKVLDKAIARELKSAQKASQKKKRTSGNRAPSGFVKPTLISDELAVFLGKEKGTELARTAVSKEIHAYIRAAKLQDPTNGRKINADAKLAKLLKLGKTDALTYFNLQKYMKHHFIKSAAPAATA